MATLAQNIQRAINDFNSIENAIVQKGVPVPDGTPTSEYGEKILSIETGVDTSGDTVVPSAMREGYTAHDAAGQEITGAIPNYDGGSSVEITSPEGATLNTAGTYCEGNIEVVPKLQSKTATTGEIVTADAGYVGLESVDTNPAFEAGKKSEYDAFWDEYQKDGNRTEYRYAFAGQGWTEKTFKPKYPIKPKDLYNWNNAGSFVFLYCNNSEVAPPLDFSEVDLDFSGCTSVDGTFANCFIKNIYCDFGNCTRITGAFEASDTNYLGVDNLKLRITDKLVEASRVFLYAHRLTNLSFTEDSIIKVDGFGLNQSMLLSKQSIINVFNVLSDDTSGLVMAFNTTAVNKAFETSEGSANGSTSSEWEELVLTKPNWTIALDNFVWP